MSFLFLSIPENAWLLLALLFLGLGCFTLGYSLGARREAKESIEVRDSKEEAKEEKKEE